MSTHNHFLYLKKPSITKAPDSMIAEIIQKSWGIPTKGRYLVFMPKIAASRVSGKTITEKMVNSLIIWFVL